MIKKQSVTLDSGKVPRVIAHRGASGHAPENTLVAFREAARQGARWVEIDAKLSRDDIAIVLHDDDMVRTTNGTGNADSLEYRNIAKLDAGFWYGVEFEAEPVPGLQDCIELFTELGLGCNVEIKPNKTNAALCGRLISEHLLRSWPDSLPPPLISSFDTEALTASYQAAPHFHRALLLNHLPQDWQKLLESLGCNAVHIGNKAADAETIRQVTDAGYNLRVFTVNDPARAADLFRWGAQTIFTDYPDRMATFL